MPKNSLLFRSKTLVLNKVQSAMNDDPDLSNNLNKLKLKCTKSLKMTAEKGHHLV